METIEELTEFIGAVTQGNVRGRLLDRGEARAIIRRDGILPDDAPALGDTLDTDLAEYAFSLLRSSLALREQQGDPAVWRLGFLKAGNAFEALVRNGSPEAPERGFWRVIGSAAYHLAGYSAMSYSLMSQQHEESNLAPAEQAIVYILLRDLRTLASEARRWLIDQNNLDGVLSGRLALEQIDPDEALSTILSTTVYRAFAYFEFALATGTMALRDNALSLLDRGLRIARDANLVSLWWIIRVARSLIDDLWQNSLHNILPSDGPEGSEDYAQLRRMFLASLYARDVAEVELWPSQLEAATRAADLTDDLVVALPTSAGKTRVAELCALMSLSVGTRVLLVTPLRALSAQTERSFRRTFSPLGYSVSSLYGASGMLAGDADALRASDIIIATPEKLDFALRSDRDIISDVGLIVLDEGHLIGPSEREIRYEILVQRLLRREDAETRRIVCLSAILPDGEQLDDLTAWIRSDQEGTAVKSDWRPTRQRFGTLKWRGQRAMLTFDVDDGGPFIGNFIEQQPPIRPRRTPFPRDNAELTLAASWKFADEGKRTLVFCTQRDHVEGYAEKIVNLAHRGFLSSLLEKPELVEAAKSIGAEWLGQDHPAVRCLDVGVAIHHARLPNPFLREVERLLSAGVLPVTVASPTLAQGLNLNAAVLLVPNLYRARAMLTGEEFANVAGRAGRAFVDLEGLVVHVMHKPEPWRTKAWSGLVNSSRARMLKSGLIQIAAEILRRLARSGVLQEDKAFEYLANNRDSWDIEVDGDGEEPFHQLLEKLDSAILGLVEALDSEADALPELIDQALNGSLWARQIVRQAEATREAQLALFGARSRLIWSSTSAEQRRGHFAMGIGMDAGLAIDAMADELASHLDHADDAALTGDVRTLQRSLTALADRALTLRPFAPEDDLPGNWRGVLNDWLAGVPVSAIGPDNLPLIEDSFTYRLVWAIESLRSRRVALGWEPEAIAGGGAACLETGLPEFRMALLVRAGLPSRAAAIAAVNELNPSLLDFSDVVTWLRSDEVVAFSDRDDWPTADTAELWQQFRDEILSGGIQAWNASSVRRNTDADTRAIDPAFDAPYRVESSDDGETWVTTPDFQHVVKLRRRMYDRRPSVLSAWFEAGSTQATIQRLGRSRARWSRR